MNQKHKDTARGGYGVTSWFPQALIDDVKTTATDVGQKPSFVIAEATRLGLSAVRRKYAQDSDAKSTEKSTEKSKAAGKNGKRTNGKK